MPDVILRNLGAIRAKQVAELCSIILLTSTKWLVFDDDADKAFLGAGLASEAEEEQ